MRVSAILVTIIVRKTLGGRRFHPNRLERFAVNPPAGAAGANPILSLTSRDQTSFIAVF